MLEKYAMLIPSCVLQVLEPLFSSETLAALLHIPHNKTLIKRHLATKLDELLPSEALQMKQKYQNQTHYQPLNVGLKYKVGCC